MSELKLLIGNGNPLLGQRVCETIGIKPTPMRADRFPDGEIRIQILDNIRGKDVFILQSTNPPADNLLELLIIIDAAKRASARRVTAVIPYFGYARQDRKEAPRMPVSGKLVANMIAKAGADRVLTLDLHSPQIQGFFDIPVDHLQADKVFYEYLRTKISLNISELVIVAPNVGAVRLAWNLAERFASTDGQTVPFALIDKHRSSPFYAQLFRVVGDVKDRIVIIRDDIIDTGSVLDAAQLMMDSGCKEVYICCTHPVLSGRTAQKVDESGIRRMLVTDTVALGQAKLVSKLDVISIGPILAEAIRRIHAEQSLTQLIQ